MLRQPRPASPRWRALGRLLPRDVRERIFEPAFGEMHYRWLTSRARNARLPFGLHAVGTLLGCLPIAARTSFVRNGRITRLGRYTLASMTLVAVVVVILRELSSRYY